LVTQAPHSFDKKYSLHYIYYMDTGAISGYRVETIQENVALSMLKKSLDFQEQAVLKLLQGLTQVHDPELGKNIDTYA
jgi:hypothetical protein